MSKLPTNKSGQYKPKGKKNFLKGKSKATLDLLASNPKLSATDAYLQTHATENRTTASTNAYKLLQKPLAQVYLQQHVSRAKERVVELVDSEKEDIALRASTDILDREYGKATQKTEVQSFNIEAILND